MKHLGDLLAGLSLPDEAPAREWDLDESDLLRDLGADLPAGHLHLWGGPPGAGKTSFLLSLLLGAVRRGRRVLHATYHLPASSLALRLLGMAASLDCEALAAGRLTPEQSARAAAARRCLSDLPFFLLEARGCSVSSLEDRLVRMPFRAEVMAVDYLQAVVRPPGEDIGSSVRAFSSLASRLHVSIVVTLQAAEETPADVCHLADRAGWITPAGGSGFRRAEVICNRYGDHPSVPLHLDSASGALERAE